jgi:2,3-dihydroxy-p-cumate/2,3-dihydroxybenzoate 3,4-dioxygenase
MIRYKGLGHIALNVTDPVRSHRFYEEVVGLRFEGTGRDGEVFLGAGRGQRLILYRGDRPGLKRLGWQMEDEAQLGLLAETLERSGVRLRELASSWIRIVEPNTGATLDFLAGGPDHSDPAAGPDGPVETLGHAVLRTSHYRNAVTFFKDVLNFRSSDEVEGWITFLRCFPNPLHHSIGIANAARNMLHHVSFLVRGLDDVHAAAKRFRESGVPIMCGPGRHPPSGSAFIYFLDPDGLTLEYSHGMEHIAEIAPRPPRVLPPVPKSLDLDANPRDPRMYTVGEIEIAPPLG